MSSNTTKFENNFESYQNQYRREEAIVRFKLKNQSGVVYGPN